MSEYGTATLNIRTTRWFQIINMIDRLIFLLIEWFTHQKRKKMQMKLALKNIVLAAKSLSVLGDTFFSSTIFLL
jgi:hypothetical protein